MILTEVSAGFWRCSAPGVGGGVGRGSGVQAAFCFSFPPPPTPDLLSPLQPPDEHTEHSGGSDASAPDAFHAAARWRKLLTLMPVAPTVQFSPLIAPCLSLAE